MHHNTSLYLSSNPVKGTVKLQNICFFMVFFNVILTLYAIKTKVIPCLHMQYSFSQSKNKKSLSIYLCLLKFFSSISYIVYRSFISLVKFIFRCFILFDAIINGIIFLISFLIVCCSCIETQLIFAYYFLSCNFTEFVH